MKRIVIMMLVLFTASAAHAGGMLPGGVQLLCHRTANEDVPENTLESLEEAALLGCNVVEIDLRRTLDRKIVLDHDGLLERLTDGTGDIETTYYGDLRMRDAGSWMGERFEGMHIVLFDDALRLARERDIRLILDMKDKDIAPEVLQLLQREGMLHRVRFGGEWEEVKQLYPQANEEDAEVWVRPGVIPEQVKAYHREGKAVIANFSVNEHEMDLAAMKAAVAAGVDGINVDYPRIGADAVGRPVEQKLAALAMKANSGEGSARAGAILELSRYRGFPLQSEFAHWLLDADDQVSRAAALALVAARPRTPFSVFSTALQASNADARANAAWSLGSMNAPAEMLLPMLRDKDPKVLQAALIALSRAPGEVTAQQLLPLLSHENLGVRSAAAVALAKHQPDVAVKEIPAMLRHEQDEVFASYRNFVRGGRKMPSQQEIDRATDHFRCEMKLLQAISMVHGPEATKILEEHAFRPELNFEQVSGFVAAFQLWDRIGADAESAVQAMGASDAFTNDKAEWMLVKGGPDVLPAVRKALDSDNGKIRERAIRVVAWQGDTESLGRLHEMQARNGPDADLAAWAIAKIESLHPQL
jgi:glycerophosphoryl diester phosphodiesterase